MSDRFDVGGKVVLITGGSRGLGRAMALAFATEGAKVVIASRKIEACEELAEQIRGEGGEAMALACHVGNWDTLEDVIESVIGAYGRIDVLVNNAGMSPVAPSLLETSEALVDKILDINLKGPLRLDRQPRKHIPHSLLKRKADHRREQRRSGQQRRCLHGSRGGVWRDGKRGRL